MMNHSRRGCVLALGFFDGVHKGHSALLQKTVERAEELALTPAVMTFDTHPDTLVFGRPVPLINSAPDRAYLIRTLFGIDCVEFFRFTAETMRMPWRDFLNSIRNELNVSHFIVGYDFCFGWKGEGNAEKLAEYCRETGLSCDIIGQVTYQGITVSSTYIRALLQNGEMLKAEEFMGHPHILTDIVHRGHRLGRQLGAPTINMQFAPDVLVPKHGVYAARVRLTDGVFPAVTNIGIRPTVSHEETVSVESHILDYTGNLYGRHIVLEFFDYLRPERRFESLAALADQINADSEHAKAIMEEHK